MNCKQRYTYAFNLVGRRDIACKITFPSHNCVRKCFRKTCLSLAIFSVAYASPTVSHSRACCQDEIQADNLPRWQRISGFYDRKIKKKSHKLTYFSRMCCKQIQVNCEASQSIFTHEFRLRTTKSICAPKKARINFKVRKGIHTRNRLPLPYVRG
jgi:hypothetical protein